MWAGSLGTIVAIYILIPVMPRQADPNHKVRMIGSRFSPTEEMVDRSRLVESTVG
jgi:hypothetical protein